MPPPRKAVSAPASPNFTQVQKLRRAKDLRAKGGQRTPAETQELIDNLIALLPPGTLGP